MQNVPVCRLRNQFLPFGYEAFCDLSSYFMFPKRIHSLPHSSFLRENETKWKHGHNDLSQQSKSLTLEVSDILLYFTPVCVFTFTAVIVSLPASAEWSDWSETCRGCADNCHKVAPGENEKADRARHFCSHICTTSLLEAAHYNHCLILFLLEESGIKYLLKSTFPNWLSTDLVQQVTGAWTILTLQLYVLLFLADVLVWESRGWINKSLPPVYPQSWEVPPVFWKSSVAAKTRENFNNIII